MSEAPDINSVLVVGAGIMGSGIAQVAAQSGHPVLLFDNRPGAAVDARAALQATFDKLVAKGKFSDDFARKALSAITPVESLEAAATVDLVVEAVIEDIEIKRGLFRQLEDIVGEDCILATNTSSISVTALANGLRYPERLVGMHFFNPVALMKLVEVVSGAKSWDKVPVHARSTPGFIVNRIARPFYAETLALLQERAATPGLLDACLRGAGFRMGPCELMDLIGHDTNFSVTRSVYEANFFDKRYAPSPVQQELVDGGLLGRKSGRGFYDYSADEKPGVVEYPAPAAAPSFDSLAVRGRGPIAERIARALLQHGLRFERIHDSKWVGLQVDSARLRLTDGRCASELGRDVAVFDLPLTDEAGTVLAWSHAGRAAEQWVAGAPDWLALIGFVPQRIADTPGLVVARTIAMLINEAADAVQQGVCSETGANDAMKLGVNYPAGPFEWLAQWHSSAVVALLDRLDDFYRGERYRVSPWLRHHAWRKSSGPAGA
jgi:3-hydroxybutyryl-CoA dehydrogenase